MTGFDVGVELPDPTDSAPQIGPQEPQKPQAPKIALVPDDEVRRLAGAEGDALVSRHTDRLRESFDAAVRSDPDAAGEAQRIAAELGIPTAGIEGNLQVAREIMRRRALDSAKLAQRNPLLAQQLEDVRFAQIAQDDIENLSGTEGWFKRLGQSFEQGQLGVERGYLGARKLAAQGGGDPFSDEDRRRLTWMNNRMAAINPLGGLIGGLAETAGASGEMMAKAALVGAGVAAATGGAGFGAGFGAAIFGQSAVTAAGNNYLAMIDAGYDPSVARRASIAAGVVDGVLMTVGNAALMKGGSALAAPIREAIAREVAGGVAASLTRPTVSGGAAAFLKSYALGHVQDVTMTLQRAVDMAFEEAARKGSPNADDLTSAVSRGEVGKELVNAFVDAFVSNALIALPGPMGGLAIDVARARRATSQATVARGISDAVEKSKVRTRNPSAHGDAVQTYAENAGAPEVYVDARTLDGVLRQLDAREAGRSDAGSTDFVVPGRASQSFAKLLPDAAAQLPSALASGDVVSIKTKDYFGALAGTDLAKQLEPHLLWDPIDISPEEADAIMRGLPQRFDEARAATGIRNELEKLFHESSRKVEEAMRVQLVSAQRMTTSEAGSAAKLYRAFIATQARRLGVTPEKLHEEMGLRVVGGSEAEANAESLSQGTRGTFDPRRFVAAIFDQQAEHGGATTFLHESAHYFLSVYSELAARENAHPLIRGDFEQLLKGFGVESPEAWAKMSLDQQRAHHEAFAYQFEEHLHSGRAPSVAQRPLFARFGAWLRSIYRTIRDELGAAYRKETGRELPILTSETRDVMDRMLASEDAVLDERATRDLEAMFENKAEAAKRGISEAEWIKMREAGQAAVDQAIDEVSRRSVSDLRWAQNAEGRALRKIQSEHRAAREGIRDQVTEEVQSQPIYRAMEILRGRVVDAESGDVVKSKSIKLDRDALRALVSGQLESEARSRGEAGGEAFFTDTMHKFRGMTEEGGVPLDSAAELIGYNGSGIDLVRDIATAPPIKDVIEARITERMQREHGDLVDPKKVREAVLQAVHNDARLRALATSLSLIDKTKTSVRAQVAAARAVAERLLSGQTVGDIDAERAHAAAGKLSRKALEAIKKDKLEEAASFLRQQLVQEQLARLASEAESEVDKALSGFRKMFEPDKDLAKTRNVDIVAAARAMLAAFSIGPPSKLPLDFLDGVRRYNPELASSLIPLVERATGGNTLQHYRDLTLAEFRDLRDQVTGVWNQARRDRQIVINKEAVALDAVTASMGRRLVELGVPETVAGEKEAVTGAQRLARDVTQAGAWLTRVEHWADAMDGRREPGAEIGPFTRYLWRLVNDANNRLTVEHQRYLERFVDLLGRVDWRGDRFHSAELDYTFTKAELVGALTHAGNKSNLKKLLLGRGWGERLPDGEVDTSRFRAAVNRAFSEGFIGKPEVEFVQALHRLTADLLPSAQEAHMDRFGYRFTEVEHSPFGTPHGPIEGYVPASTDKYLVDRAAERLTAEQVSDNFRMQLPQAESGFTKDRVENYTRPLSLDVRTIAKHIHDVLTFVHMGPAVADAVKILRQRDLQTMLGRFQPSAMSSMLIPWLDRSARQSTTRRSGNDLMDAFFNGIRRRSSMSLLFSNLSTALQNLTGFFPAALKTRPGALLRGLWDHATNPRETARQVAADSEFMNGHLSSQMSDLRDDTNRILLSPGVYAKAQEWTGQHGHWLMRAMQNPVDIATWMGTYSDELRAMGATRSDASAHAEAVQRADAAVRMTQGGSRPIDVAAFQVGSPGWKVMTQFTNYWNVLANLNAGEMQKAFREFGWRRGMPRILARGFAIYALGFALPSLVADAIGRSFSGRWGKEDDDGLTVFADWFFGSQVRGLTSFVPLAGPAVGAVIRYAGGEGSDRLPAAPAIRALESAFGAVDAVSAAFDPEKDLTGRQVRDVATLLSLTFGLPLSAPAAPAAFGVDLARGKAQPQGTIDYLRGFATGR